MIAIKHDISMSKKGGGLENFEMEISCDRKTISEMDRDFRHRIVRFF